MISVFELVQVVVLVVAAAGISNVCERWAARTGRIGTARKSSAAVAKANTPGNQSVGDDIDEPALPSVKPQVKAVPATPKPDASKKTAATDPKPQPAVPATKEVPRAVTPPPSGAAVGGSAGDDDLDALLNSALDAEAEAEDLLDNILGAEDTDSDAKEKPASVKAVAAPKPESKPAAAPAATKPKAEAAPKAAASSPPPKKDSMDDLLDSALDEVGEADALLDACLDNPDAASAAPAADSKLTGQPDGSPSLPADGATSDPSSKEGDPVPNVDGPKRRPSRGGRLQGSSSGDHDSSTRPPELVFPIAMRAAKRPAPDHTRASELMRMGRELLELRKFQAALDTLCSAHRFVNLGSDEGLRNAIKTGIRAVYTQHGEEAKFADEALPFL
jgi:hypothetical protein